MYAADMKRILLSVVFLCACAWAAQAALSVGVKAPDFTTQAALAYAASTGRSRTTVNVQANKLGYSMKGAAFEPRAVK